MGFSSPNSGKRAPMVDINITPLVDVMLVLLIMFMVTAPLMQQGIDVDLPETAASGIEPSGEDPFVLVINKKGQFLISDIKVPRAELRKKLGAIFKLKKAKQIYIQADKTVDYGIVATAMAEAKAAGIHNIGLVTVPNTQ